jgi:hypothetical protein
MVYSVTIGGSATCSAQYRVLRDDEQLLDGFTYIDSVNSHVHVNFAVPYQNARSAQLSGSLSDMRRVDGH